MLRATVEKFTKGLLEKFTKEGLLKEPDNLFSEMEKSRCTQLSMLLHRGEIIEGWGLPLQN